LDKVNYQQCKAQILVVSDLKAMTRAINTRVKFHVEEMRKGNMPETQIRQSKEEIESSLIEEIIKEIYCKNLPSPQDNRKPMDKPAQHH